MSGDSKARGKTGRARGPVQAVPDPVINKPYEEPAYHWVYTSDGHPFKQQGRRPASYYTLRNIVGSMQQDLYAEEERDDLPLVNRLRADVKRWREAGYRGASRSTKQLLQYWTRDDRPRPLFFCQVEAIETLIYLLELGFQQQLARTRFGNLGVTQDSLATLLEGTRPDFDEMDDQSDFWPTLLDQPGDSNLKALIRLGCKMATGSGKTLVMAMLITWGLVNRAVNPSSQWFPNAILVMAPNLTVKERLQVLRPEHVDNYYKGFDLVPPSYWPFVNDGKILVTNWHTLAMKGEHSEDGTSYRVVEKGTEPWDAFTKNRLGDLAQRLPILVLNDEGHHCWRPKLTDSEFSKLSGTEKQDAEEARIWLAGLDRINNCGIPPEGGPGILAAIDFSATPFYFGNSGHPEGRPFPWLVSDFGLVDAIECGIVKVPRLPVRDDAGGKDDAGRPDPKYFRLWHRIIEELNSSEKIKKKPTPEAIYAHAEGALQTLYAQWLALFRERLEKISPDLFVPPVLIIVCNDTEIAQYFFEKVSGEKTLLEKVPGKKNRVKTTQFNGSSFEELANSPDVGHTVQIDSRRIEQQEIGNDESKAQAAAALRHIVDTVGRRGEPGEHVRCVVSVSMLTEGWDANNVTHILGVRAFGSQLLSEQVVGRGLRRTSYTPDPESGLLPVEYVDVYGIPFSLIPYKGKTKKADGPDPVYVDVYPLPDRADKEIRVPLVRSYTYELRDAGISCDLDSLEPLEISVRDEPTQTWVRVQRGVIDGSVVVDMEADTIKQDRALYYESFRTQQFEFNTARQIVDDLVAESDDASVNRALMFPEILRILRAYLAQKVKVPDGVDKREIALELNARRLRERLKNGIVLGATKTQAPLLPVLNLVQPYVSTAQVYFKTTRPVVYLKNSHLNCAPVLSEAGEAKAIEILEGSDHVQFFAPNISHMGFVIGYEFQGRSAHYEPDFFVRLSNDVTLVLEIKGVAGELHFPDMVNAKNAAAKKWVNALNNLGDYGHWVFAICRNMDELASLLSMIAGATDGQESYEC